MQPIHFARVLGPVSAALLALGCASAPAPAPTVLEVSNRTDSNLVISIGGDGEGVVAAGARRRFRNLSAGSVRVVAAPDRATGSEAPRFEAELQLLPGSNPWELKIEGLDRPVPPALVDLEIHSELEMDVEVYFRGHRVGLLLAGDTRHFRDLSAGAAEVEARATSGWRSTRRIELRPEDPNRIVLSMATASMEIVNDTDESVEVIIDGGGSRKIEAGASGSWDDLAEGRYDVLAVADGGRRYKRAVTLRVDFPVRWRLSRGVTSGVAVNEADEAVALVLPDGTTKTVQPGESVDLSGIQPGTVEILGRGVASGATYATSAVVGPEQRYTWQIAPARATLTVHNNTPDGLVVFIGADPVGRIAAGAATIIGNLPGESFDVAATSERGTARYQTHIALDGSLSASWAIAPARGVIHVRNSRAETMTLHVEGHRVGSVVAGGAAWLTGVLPGRRTLDAVGERSHERLQEIVAVVEGEPAEVLLETPLAALQIINRSGEDLVLGPPLDAQAGRVVADGSVELRMGIGQHALKAMGADSGAVYTTRLRVDAQGPAVWIVEAAVGAIMVRNLMGETMTVDAGGGRVAEVESRQDVVIGGVPVGRHRILAEGAASGVVRDQELAVGLGATALWVIEPVPARLVVDNRSGEAVSVALDAAPVGIVAAGARRSFIRPLAGRTVVDVVGNRSGTAQRFELQLEQGRVSEVGVLPPWGTLWVANDSGEDVEIRADGRVIGSIRAGAERQALAVPAGARALAISYASSGSTTWSRLAIEPAEVVDFRIPARLAELTVTNRTGGPVGVFLRDRKIADLADDESHVQRALAPGALLIRAERPDGAEVWIERRTLTAGEVAVWEISAP